MAFDAPLVTAVGTAAFPTVAVVIGILVNNSRLGDVNVRIGEFRADINRRFDEVDRRFAETDRRFTETDRKILDTRDLLRGELFRMEQVFDARLKHIEESR